MNGDPVRTGRFDRRRWSVAGGLVTAASTLAVVGLLAGQTTASAAEAPVPLGTAASYSVLGGVTVTNTGDTILGGDLGVSPGTAITGFPPGLVGGATNAGNAVAAQAQSDLVIAYDDAAGRAPTASVSDDLVGQVLPGGVYKSTGPLSVSGTLTLDGQNDPSSVFIFQIASTLITASASTIDLVNGAQPCNVYWQVGSSATLGTNSSFIGSVLALTSITVNTGAVVEGRALARNGQVSLDDNVFTVPGCDLTPITTTTTDVTTTTTDDTTTTAEPTTTTDTTTTTDETTTTTDTSTTDTSTTEPTTTTTEPTTTTTELTTTTTEPTTTTTDTSTTDETTTTTGGTTTTTEETTTTTDTTTTDTTTTDTSTTDGTTTTRPTTDSTTTESTTTTDGTTTDGTTTTTTPSTTEESTTTTTPTTTGSTTSGTTAALEATTGSSITSWTASGTSTTDSAVAGRKGVGSGERVWTDDSESGYYSSGLAGTGVSSGLGSALAIGVLLLLGGALLLVTLRSRKSRKM